jgi:hypothetical protein
LALRTRRRALSVDHAPMADCHHQHHEPLILDGEAAGASSLLFPCYSLLSCSIVAGAPARLRATRCYCLENPGKASAAAHSLLIPCYSLFGLQKFPVPLRREFHCNRQKLQANFACKTAARLISANSLLSAIRARSTRRRFGAV